MGGRGAGRRGAPGREIGAVVSGGMPAAVGPLVSTAWLAEHLGRTRWRRAGGGLPLVPEAVRHARPRRRIRPRPYPWSGASALGHALGRPRPSDPGDVGSAEGVRRDHGRCRHRRAHHGRGLRRRARHRGGPPVVGAAGLWPRRRGGPRRGNQSLAGRGSPPEHRSAVLAAWRFRGPAALDRLCHAPRCGRGPERSRGWSRGLPHGTRPGRGRGDDSRQRLPAGH